eukprot:760267-Hanusia_phi.AAC.4
MYFTLIPIPELSNRNAYAQAPGLQQLVLDNRLGGPLDIGYPCGAIWCESVPDNSELISFRLLSTSSCSSQPRSSPRSSHSSLLSWSQRLTA